MIDSRDRRSTRDFLLAETRVPANFFEKTIGTVNALVSGMAGWKSVDEIIAYQLSVKLRDLMLGLIDSGAIPHNYRFREDIAAAARSAPSNISEGFDLYGHGRFSSHVAIAKGSLGELKSHLTELRKRRFITETQYTDLVALAEETKRTTNGLLRHLKTTEAPSPWTEPPDSIERSPHD